MPGTGDDWPYSHVREPMPARVTPAPPSAPPADADDFDFERDRREAAVSPEDEQHLRWLSMSYYIVGGIMGLCACLPIFHFLLGLGMITGSIPVSKGAGPPPPPALGWMFLLIAAGFMAAGWSLTIGLLVAGHMLRRRRAYVFCLVMAGFAMLQQPFGTVLGVFTIIVLMRPSVKQLFGRTPDASRA